MQICVNIEPLFALNLPKNSFKPASPHHVRYSRSASQTPESTTDVVDRGLSQHGGPQADVPMRLVLAIDHRLIEDANILTPTQLFEVAEGAEVNIRRIVPIIRQALRHWHPAF